MFPIELGYYLWLKASAGLYMTASQCNAECYDLIAALTLAKPTISEPFFIMKTQNNETSKALTGNIDKSRMVATSFIDSGHGFLSERSLALKWRSDVGASDRCALSASIA